MLQSTESIFLFYWLMRSFRNITCSTIRDISMICLFGASYIAVLHLCVLPTCSCLLNIGKDGFLLENIVLSVQFIVRTAVFRCGQKRRNPLCWYLNFALKHVISQTHTDVSCELQDFALYCATERIQLKIKVGIIKALKTGFKTFI